MGQAKRRGTTEQRVADAMKRARSQLPVSVKCNNCQTDLTEIQPLDVRGLEGMRLAGMAHCHACQYDTWVLDGDSHGLQLFQRFMEEHHGSAEVSASLVRRP